MGTIDHLIATQDGAHTVRSERFNATYHSQYGAIQEADTVFIQAALAPVLSAAPAHIRVLEMGLGTGLNALMTFQALAAYPAVTLQYTALEAYPLSAELAAALNFADHLAHPEAAVWLHALHQASWDTPTAITPNITLEKRLQRFETFDGAAHAGTFDVVYYDAFAPSAQPELWTEAIFQPLFQALRPGGVLTTYCVKGEVRRHLQAVGFQVEKLPGPKGKREITRATRPAL